MYVCNIKLLACLGNKIYNSQFGFIKSEASSPCKYFIFCFRKNLEILKHYPNKPKAPGFAEVRDEVTLVGLDLQVLGLKTGTYDCSPPPFGIFASNWMIVLQRKILEVSEANPKEFPWTCTIWKDNKYIGVCAIIPQNHDNDITKPTNKIITVAHIVFNVSVE